MTVRCYDAVHIQQLEKTMPQVQRDREIRRRRHKRDKLKAIRTRLLTERDAKVRGRLLARLKKISPTAPVPEK
jgi:hypothetical protein